MFHAFLGIDEANNFANLLRAILPRHGFVISEPYPIVSDSLEKEFKETDVIVLLTC